MPGPIKMNRRFGHLCQRRPGQLGRRVAKIVFRAFGYLGEGKRKDAEEEEEEKRKAGRGSMIATSPTMWAGGDRTALLFPGQARSTKATNRVRVRAAALALANQSRNKIKRLRSHSAGRRHNGPHSLQQGAEAKTKRTRLIAAHRGTLLGHFVFFFVPDRGDLRYCQASSRMEQHGQPLPTVPRTQL